MDTTTLATLTEAARVLATGGPSVLLLALLYAIHAGHLVLRREYRKLEQENERIHAELTNERAAADALAAAATHALDKLASYGDGGPHDRR